MTTFGPPPRPRCRTCGGWSHATSLCPWGLEDRTVPLEREPQNGPYNGPLKVRVLPFGVSSGEDLRYWDVKKGDKGRRKRWRKG